MAGVIGVMSPSSLAPEAQVSDRVHPTLKTEQMDENISNASKEVWFQIGVDL